MIFQPEEMGVIHHLDRGWNNSSQRNFTEGDLLFDSAA
ncbi:hypothetical protein AC26_1053 [Escherichia coli 1-176-05_S3_C2]|nr:hypothetical protein AC26_1053 [Escherichia coli 1-176-05_S3_C2]